MNSPSKGMKTVSGRYPRFELRDEHKAELKEAFDVFDREGTGIIDIRGLRVILRALGFETEKEELKRLVGKYTRGSVPKSGPVVGEETMTDDKQSEPPQSRQQQLRDASRPSTAAQQDGDEGKADEQEEDGEEGSPREHGTLDFYEFLEIMLEKMTEQDSRAVVEKAYHMFKGESGKVSHANLKSLAMELGEHLSEDELNEMMKGADVDGDGLISEEEFMRIILKPDSRPF
ncbi:centrin, putative [Perkinsus marinus ATCC 50983]|uniref:Centrin, putative n=1 Tax=Perkinsus marinus (strain ATCC 50983 / TXsc) TaxID=423536 RepID=C5LY16_PERM5|nr:centrin, putative [Perkinsus marinus ATCC 50983]EEQ98346.1 centrin, putative [Perkinsus marinus ATCC 50983]|eukprot:XP_002765629.1 centrin, putative [Perkinsus marinus ATCC 50983]